VSNCFVDQSHVGCRKNSVELSAQEVSLSRREQDVGVQADRSLLLILNALLLHHLVDVVAGRNFGSLLLLGALGLLLRDSLLLVVVALVRSSLGLAALLGLTTLGLSGLALLRYVLVIFEWKCLIAGCVLSERCRRRPRQQPRGPS
jgi:hypothetical protein